MGAIVVKPPVLAVDRNVALLSADLVGPGGVRRLWFECDPEHADKLCADTCDGFALVGLLVAMRHGLDLVVEGAMSSQLYYNLTSHYAELLRTLVGGPRKISIQAKQLTRAHWGGGGALSGFSAGVDSFCTILEHRTDQVPAEFRLTGLVFNNVGSHGQTADDLAVYQDRLARLTMHARMLGLPLIAVNSNLDAVIDMDFQLTHTLRNVAVALLLQKGFSKYLYASTVHYRDSHAAGSYDMGHADALAVGLFSTETMACISSGGQHTRFEKTELIATFGWTHRMLDVCVAPARARKTNCSKCWKCLRTEVALEIIGALEDYAEVFDLDVYRRYRWLYLCSIMGSRDPLQKEIRDEIQRRRFRVPISARLFGAILPSAVINLVLKLIDTDRERLTRVWRRVRQRIRGPAQAR
jgi:hypothetical protein